MQIRRDVSELRIDQKCPKIEAQKEGHFIWFKFHGKFSNFANHQLFRSLDILICNFIYLSTHCNLRFK